MSTLSQIKADQLQARKAGQRDQAAFLTTLVSEIAMKGKNDGNREATDVDAKDVLAKWLKNAKEVIRLAPNPSAVETANLEISWLEAYLPKQMDESTLRQHIVDIVNSHGTGCNIGVIMKELKLHYDGQFDGKTASSIAKEVLT